MDQTIPVLTTRYEFYRFIFQFAFGEDVAILWDKGWGDAPLSITIIRHGDGHNPEARITPELWNEISTDPRIRPNVLKTFKARRLYPWKGYPVFVLFWDKQPIGVVDTEKDALAVQEYFLNDGSGRLLAPALTWAEVNTTFDPEGPKRYELGSSRFRPSSRPRTRQDLKLWLTFEPTLRPDILKLAQDYDGSWLIGGSVVAWSKAEAGNIVMDVLQEMWNRMKDTDAKGGSWYGGDTYIIHDGTDVFTHGK